jgi:hypothetical protein
MKRLLEHLTRAWLRVAHHLRMLIEQRSATVMVFKNGVSTMKYSYYSRNLEEKMTTEYLFSAIRVFGAHHYYYHLPI